MAEREKLDIPEGRFPSNSSYSSIRPIAKGQPIENEPVKVVKGTVKEKKKSLAEKIADAFIATDGKDIGDYFLFDVLIPGLKRGVEDLVHMLLYSDKKSGKIERSRGESRIKRVEYSSLYDRRRDEEEALTASVRASRNATLIFDTRKDAEDVLDMVADRIEDAGFATLKYYFSISGMPTDWTQTKWGWHDVSGAKILQNSDGRYVLKMPRLEEV